jgi:bifunctional non-homologous end joining protein LigD
VVQKHDASRLHYDFRLAINGVLVSWAVPKGPSMNPAERHLAIRTEDHPLEYADFEGVIPGGQYGAGTVMVWDRGTYDPQNDSPPEKQLVQGKIEVVLHGTKLRGGFALIRTRSSINSRNKEGWLLIKERDEYTDPSWSVEDPRFDRSALTGRSLKEIEGGGTKKVAAADALTFGGSLPDRVCRRYISGRQLGDCHDPKRLSCSDNNSVSSAVLGVSAAVWSRCIWRVAAIVTALPKGFKSESQSACLPRANR